MILQGAFRRVAIGLLLGLPLAVGAGRLLASQLYGVQFWDPLALGLAAIALAICACCAAIIPAARAASISPMSALRESIPDHYHSSRITHPRILESSDPYHRILESDADLMIPRFDDLGISDSVIQRSLISDWPMRTQRKRRRALR